MNAYDEPIGIYERYHDGQYASWEMMARDLKSSPEKDFITGMVFLVVSIGVMLFVAPYGMCYTTPLSSWRSACQFHNTIRVVQGENIELTSANCDTIYDKEAWQDTPKIIFPNADKVADKRRYYTVFVIDPDAPDHPNGTYYLHMLQANVKGEDFAEGNFGKALTIAPYVAPAPPEGTNYHRYMFVAYRHCMLHDTVPPMEIPERLLFDLDKWLASLPFKMIGPIAGVQFRAGY